MPEPMLELHQVNKHFGGLRAVDEVSFTVEAGVRGNTITVSSTVSKLRPVCCSLGSPDTTLCSA